MNHTFSHDGKYFLPGSISVNSEIIALYSSQFERETILPDYKYYQPIILRVSSALDWEKSVRLNITVQLDPDSTYTANVPALTGIALSKVGPIPFQKPINPDDLQVCLKQSDMLLYRIASPKPSLCILLFTTSNG
jgi:hypothetical protein